MQLSDAVTGDAIHPKTIPRPVEIAKPVTSEHDSARVLTAALDTIITILNAEKSAIIFFLDSDKLQIFSGRNSKKETIGGSEFNVNASLLSEVKITGKPLCWCNHSPPTMLYHRRDRDISSVVCLPLNDVGKTFGVVYVDHACCAFKLNVMPILKTIADFLSPVAHQVREDIQSGQNLQSLEIRLRNTHRFEAIVGHDPKIVEILKLVSQIANTEATVLIQGESGTGKELIARALHSNGRRKCQPFIPINCGALPENLLESELFGHVRGAFTGAIKNKRGWFACADGGTIFLDEVHEMSPGLQVKLLRVLQTGQYSPVGSTEISTCDMRVIAATTKNLTRMIREDQFRGELYYRLNVIDIKLPPLRDRKCDIALLIQHFLKFFHTKYGKENLRISRDAESLLLSYTYPGNVRELENIIERAVVLAEGRVVRPEHLPACVHQSDSGLRRETPLSFQAAKRHVVERFEREYIIDCLKATKGNISRAARTAGMHFTNFYKKMRKYEIDPFLYKKL